MRRYIHIEFLGLDGDLSLSAAVHWYVAHLAGASIEVHDIAVTIDTRGSHVVVGATLTRVGGSVTTATASEGDSHAALAKVFAQLRRGTAPKQPVRRPAQFHALAG
jgi:hypothetical protein